MKRVIGGVLAAWGAIVALAWWLADKRVDECYSVMECKIATMAARDYVLIVGLIVPLALFVGLAIAGLVRFNRQSANRELRPRSPR